MITSRSEILLKAFIAGRPPERQKRLERLVSEPIKRALQNAPSFSENITPEALTSEPLLDLVHWSWFLPALKIYSESEQVGFLSSLSSSSALKLSQSLQLPPPSMPLTKIARSYFRSLLERSLTLHKKNLLPLNCLPPSPLNALPRLAKKKLIHLINLLSLHDLAAELRQIVETKILKKIYSFLTEEEKKRLKEITSLKESFPIPRLGLDRWDGQEDSLRVLLHKRGLARLGLALSRQDPDLVWYLSHRLDIGRGTNLQAFSSKEAGLEKSEWIIREIDELIRNYL